MSPVLGVGAVALLLIGPATLARAEEPTVRVEQGLVSATFEATPVPAALAALRGATGIEIVVPAAALAKSVTLQVDGLPFERVLRRLLEELDLGGFALVYEPGGGAGRVIVLDRGAGAGPSAPAPSDQPVGAPIPTYVPPREAPVYIPPREPPVYIPPRTPPVYVPPRTPPVYVPPATPPQGSP